ncbi:MAG: hypothetical protein JXJ04_02580 [Spirochaetales bacterium]|nr:hypothetical protein [Spirochaetales bacterium]
MPPDSFSIRWTGTIESRITETYTFYTQSDDGMRVRINNVLVIDDWNDHAASEEYEARGTIALEMGVRYPIVVEFYENGGDAALHLWWSNRYLPREIVPQSQLYSGSTPTTGPTAVTTPDPTATPGGGCFLLGDINDDGTVDIVDALLVAQYYVGLNPDIDTACAEVNCDGTIDIIDALLIAQYYVGLITSLVC